jgi:hypothetical protein
MVSTFNCWQTDSPNFPPNPRLQSNHDLNGFALKKILHFLYFHSTEEIRNSGLRKKSLLVGFVDATYKLCKHLQ